GVAASAAGATDGLAPTRKETPHPAEGRAAHRRVSQQASVPVAGSTTDRIAAIAATPAAAISAAGGERRSIAATPAAAISAAGGRRSIAGTMPPRRSAGHDPQSGY